MEGQLTQTNHKYPEFMTVWATDTPYAPHTHPHVTCPQPALRELQPATPTTATTTTETAAIVDEATLAARRQELNLDDMGRPAD